MWEERTHDFFKQEGGQEIKHIEKLSEKILGIDLGNSNCAAAVYIDEEIVLIPSLEGISPGGKAFPSCIAFNDDGDILIGEPAKKQIELNSGRTFRNFKRYMGTKYFERIGHFNYLPEELSALLLIKIKYDTEKFLGEKIYRAVISVPAHFDSNQRAATKKAAEIAGFKVERLISGPTAACLTHGLHMENQKSSNIAILNLGGGTFDITIMNIERDLFYVVSTSGDNNLGGIDFDKAIAYWIIKRFKKQHKELKLNNDAFVRIMVAAEKAKIDLSSLYETRIYIPYIVHRKKKPIHIDFILTRHQFEELIEPILKKIISPMKLALEGAKPSHNMINKLIITGGSTRIPCVRETFMKFFGKKIDRSLDPMDSICKGAAILGNIISGNSKNTLLIDVIPIALSIETEGGRAKPLIERNTQIPCEKTEIFSTSKTSVVINVLQGERPLAYQNLSLGKFRLEAKEHDMIGEAEIEVTFSVDINAIINVSAKNLGTGKSQSITVEEKFTSNEDFFEMKNSSMKELEKKYQEYAFK